MNEFPKLTQEQIDGLVQSASYHHEQTTTICVLHLRNGARVVGHSNVLHPMNYDKDICKQVAFDNAKAKLWELEGYAIKTRGA